jgi:D-alanyl-D-alanine carboxypeptidase
MKFTTAFFLIITNLLFGQSLFAQTKSSQKLPDSTDKYSKLLDKGIKHGFPGLILGVQKKGQKTFVTAAGLSNIEKQKPMRSGDRFHIASITKIFTAVAVLKLIDAGQLSLNTKVADLLDKKLIAPIPYIKEIKVSQLLDHSSGIYGFNNDKEYIETWIGGKVKDNIHWTPEKFVALADGGRVEPFGKPGSGHFYSDTNYVLLGLIVEKITGKSLREYVSEEIFKPLKMKNTAYYGEKEKPVNFAMPITVAGYLKRSEVIDSIVKLDSGFHQINKDLVNTTKAVEKTDAAAGIVSTAADLLKFGRAFYDGKLLSPELMKWFFSFGEGIEKTPVGTDRQAITTIHHQQYGVFYASTGDSPGGINATLVYHPQTETLLVAFTNIFGLFDEIDFIYQEMFGEILSQ